MIKQGNNEHGSFYILVDGVRFVYKDSWFYNSNPSPSGAASITVELEAGQVVSIENFGSDTVYGKTHFDTYYNSWFSGHLLYTL